MEYYTYYKSEQPDKITVFSGQNNRRDKAAFQLYERRDYPKRKLKNIKVKTKSLSSIISTLDRANSIVLKHDIYPGDIHLPLVPNTPTNIKIVARRTAPPWLYSIDFNATFIEQHLEQAAPLALLDGLQRHHLSA